MASEASLVGAVEVLSERAQEIRALFAEFEITLVGAEPPDAV